jgi:hypothetical protein
MTDDGIADINLRSQMLWWTVTLHEPLQARKILSALNFIEGHGAFSQSTTTWHPEFA